MKTLLGKLFWGAVLALGVTVSAHAFIVDDFNTTNFYDCEDPTGAGDFCAPTNTPIDTGNIVWGASSNHTAAGITRTIDATLNQGDRVATEICNNCQAGHVVADAGVTPSQGDYSFDWAGPSVTLNGVFSFDWSSDLSGTTWSVTFTDDAGVTNTIPGPGPLPGGFVLTTVGVPLGAFPATPGQGYGDIVGITLNFAGVPAIDGNIDNVQVTPEPELLALFGLGLMGLGWQARRRRRV